MVSATEKSEVERGGEFDFESSPVVYALRNRQSRSKQRGNQYSQWCD